MKSSESKILPSLSNFISWVLDNIVCKVSESWDSTSIWSIASTIWLMRSSPQPSKQDLVNDLNKYRGELLRSNTKRYLAGTESLPLLSILFSNVDRNKSTQFLQYTKLFKTQFEKMGLYGISWDIMVVNGILSLFCGKKC